LHLFTAHSEGWGVWLKCESSCLAILKPQV
jgi:hypothetical protein